MDNLQNEICMFNRKWVSISKNEYRSDGTYEIIGANGILGYIDRINNKQKAITTGRVGTIGTAYKIEKAG